jgi:hypothetical protein
MRARLAAYAMHTKYPDGKAITQKAREAFQASFTTEAEKKAY